MTTTQIVPTFDYTALDLETRVVIQQRASEIKSLMRRATQDTLEIGGKFTEVRDLLRHNKAGGFDRWIETEGWQRGTVYNLIHVYQAFGNIPNFGRLDLLLSALYILAAPSTPESAREEILRLAAEGQKFSLKETKDIIADHKQPILKGLPDPKPSKVIDQVGDPVGINDDLTPPPDETPVTSARTADGHWITEDGVILRYDPSQRAFCPKCNDYRHWILTGQDTWTCKSCGIKAHDDAMQLWEPEDKQTPLRGKPAAKPSTPITPEDDLLADLEIIQRLARKHWQEPRTRMMHQYLDTILITAGRAIKEAGLPPDPLAATTPERRNPFGKSMGH